VSVVAKRLRLLGAGEEGATPTRAFRAPPFLRTPVHLTKLADFTCNRAPPHQQILEHRLEIPISQDGAPRSTREHDQWPR